MSKVVNACKSPKKINKNSNILSSLLRPFFLSLSHHIISKFEYPLAQLTYNP
jgi:hypothetical protein